MASWLFPWSGFFRSPLSGDVNQDYKPVTTWFSPQLEVNYAGDREIESEVVSEVAGYGKQLGTLIDAVLELADGEKGKAVAELKSLSEQVEKVKKAHAAKLEARVREDLRKLQQQNPTAFAALMKEYR